VTAKQCQTQFWLHHACCYDAGELDVMPWNEMGGLHKETSAITQQLAQLNRAGYLTINSQPLVNAAPSDDPKVGWGGPGGYVKFCTVV
jgi:methylenetetrahydrofolate reductase (NADPH)